MGGAASKAPEGLVPGPLPGNLKKEDLDITLYVFPGSMPCEKIKFLCAYHKVPYKIVAVSFMGKKEIEWSSYKKVPQAVVNNVHICDSPEIFKQLWPIVSGKKMSEEEAKLEHDEIAYGLQPSGEVVLFKNSADMKITVDKVMGMGPIGGILGYVLAPVLPLTEEKMRESNPDMKTPAEHLANLKAALGSKDFFGGAAPGAVDISLHGTYGPYFEAGVPGYLRMVQEAGLTAYHERMSKHVKERLEG